MRLKDKVALVTGCRRGIGRAIAEALAAQGAHIIANDLAIDDTSSMVTSIRDQGRRVFPVVADITDKQAVTNMVAAALQAFERIDILINNAGNYPAAPLLEIPEAQWDAVIDVNLKGTFLVTQTVVQQAMLPQQHGRIVNITSCDGKTPTVGITHYAAAKAGVISLTKSFALELAPYGITANAVAPGWVSSETVLKGDRWKAVVKNIPCARLADPSEIAHGVVFLVEERSAYINGEILDINGGLIMD